MNTASLYSRTTLVAAMELVVSVRRFFTSTFFSTVVQLDTDSVLIDEVKSGRRLAPFVHPDHEGKPKQRRGFKTKMFQIPYIKELITLTAHELLSRQAGQQIFSDGSLNPADLAIRKMAAELQESSDAIDRRIEWMCAQLLQTGKVTCVGEGMEETIDFELPTAQNVTLSGANLWSATTTATPVTNLLAWKRVCSKVGGTITDWVIGQDARDYFFNNTVEVKGANSSFNQMRIDIGQIAVQAPINGVTLIARLPEIGNLWQYDEWYADDLANNEEKPLVDPKKVIGISSGARRSLYFGAIQDLDAFAMVQKFPKTWRSENPSKQMGLLQSAPLPAIHDIRGLIVAKVIA
jgi:hypothetical protein